MNKLYRMFYARLVESFVFLPYTVYTYTHDIYNKVLIIQHVHEFDVSGLSKRIPLKGIKQGAYSNKNCPLYNKNNTLLGLITKCLNLIELQKYSITNVDKSGRGVVGTLLARYTDQLVSRRGQNNLSNRHQSLVTCDIPV